MSDETKPVIVPEEEKKDVKFIDPNEIISRLKKKQTGLYSFPESVQLDCVFGMDPEKTLSTSGWSCFLNAQKLPEGMVIIADQGEITTKIENYFSITQVKEVRFNGKSYIVDRDAWGHPSVYLKQEALTQKPQGEFKETLEKTVSLWEAAIQGEEEIKKVIVDLFGEEVLEIITNLLAQLEEYPEIHAHKLWAEKTDLWDIAYKGKTLAGAKKILKGEDGGVKLPHGLDNTPMFKKCEEIVEKIINHQSLSDKDRYLIDAIKVSRITVRRSIRNDDYYCIDDFTRKYAMANLVENLLCRELVGWDVYEQHRQEFGSFTNELAQSGYEMPAWFQPYQGNEFIWSFALDRRIANALGQYFLNVNSDADFITRILDHERLHRLQIIASGLGLDDRLEAKQADIKFNQEKYTESFTESLALLVRHRGDVQAAMTENNERGISYKNGVNQLLNILNEIIISSGDHLLAAQLMVDGLKGMAAGRSQTVTDEVQKYYDSQLAQPGDFDALMAPYIDSNLILIKWSETNKEKEQPDISSLTGVIRQTILEIKYDDLSEQEKKQYLLSADNFDKHKDKVLSILKKWPTDLVGKNISPLISRILRAVSNNEAAKNQLKSLLNFDYEQYVLALRQWLDTGEGVSKKLATKPDF